MLCTKCFNQFKGETREGTCGRCVQLMIGSISPDDKRQALKEYREDRARRKNRKTGRVRPLTREGRSYDQGAKRTSSVE